jgi:hypothetical protein
MIVLLTGGSRGIGKGIKEIFENQNHTVISPSKLEMDLSDVESVKSYLNTIYYYNTDWNVSWDSPQSENGTFSLTSIKAMFYVKGTYLNFSWRFNISNSTSDNNMNFVFLLPQKIDSSYYEFSSNQRILSEISFNNVKYYNSSPYINYTDLKWYNAESSYNNSIQFYISFDSDISSFNSDITVKGMAEILI